MMATDRQRRNLAPEEAALWARVAATVAPYRAVPELPPLPPAPAAPLPLRSVAAVAARPVVLTPSQRRHDAATLDAGWDRRLSRGMVAPESALDLHGHTLDSAWRLLDHGLEQAIRRGDRVLLLITGKPPRPDSERPHARGAIRAKVGDWLTASRHATAIAAVRGAHIRHGGPGALYLVLKRRRVPGAKS